jgi:hypothetical protein
MKIVLAVLALTGLAHAAPRVLDLARVLGGYERTASADDIRALGPEADRLLIDHAEASGQTRVQRQRAIVALRFTPTARARAYAQSLLQASIGAGDGPSVVDAAAAITALSAYPDTLPLLLPHLSHRAAEVRQSVAAAIGVLRAREAVGSIQLRLSIESDAGVRVVLGKVLRALRD